jgi:hypothetical protein
MRLLINRIAAWPLLRHADGGKLPAQSPSSTLDEREATHHDAVGHDRVCALCVTHPANQKKNYRTLRIFEDHRGD